MSFPDIIPDLRARMPQLRGRLLANQPLGEFTWFRVGGPAQVFFMPDDENDLAYFLRNLPAEMPVTTIGAGSNLIVRDGGVAGDVIFTSATFQGRAGEPEAIAAEMAAIKDKRAASQPRNRTGGSTFKNPPGHSAWKLVDEAGCRGLKVGQAQVSELHSNFLISLDGASAADIETLGETVRARVKETSGIELEWEIKRIGVNSYTSP